MELDCLKKILNGENEETISEIVKDRKEYLKQQIQECYSKINELHDEVAELDTFSYDYLKED